MAKKFLLPIVSMLVGVFYSSFSFSQTPEQERLIVERYDRALLLRMEGEFKIKEDMEKQKALDFARANNIPVVIELADGGTAELQRIETDGSLIYFRTFNVAAARSTRTNHLNIGGSTGFNLDGQT